MSIASEYTSDRARDGLYEDDSTRTHVPLLEGYRAIAHQNLYASALAAAYRGTVMPIPSPALSADADARRIVLLDPTVRQSYDIRTVSVAGRDWSLEAGDDTPEAEHLAQVVEADLRKIRSFSEARVNLAGAFLPGTAYAYIESDLVYRWGAQWRIPSRLQDIDYRTIRFVPRDGVAVRQWAYDENTRHISTYVDVPDGTPLISVVHGDVQAALGTGLGIVDVLYPIVYNRAQLQNLALEVAETFGKGILTAKIGDLRIDDEDAAGKLSKWTATLDNLRRNYNTLVYGDSDEFNVVHGPESGLTTMLEWLRYWDDIIRSLTLGASMPFGGGSGAGPGSQARADTEDGVVDDRIAYERERLNDELTEQLVGWYCRQNRAGLYKLGIPPTTALPRFAIESGEASTDPVEFLDVVERMEKLGAPISIETLFDRTQIPRPLPGETLIQAKEDPAAGMGGMGAFFTHARAPERFAAGGFDESKHDRASDGKFAPKGGGGDAGGDDDANAASWDDVDADTEAAWTAAGVSPDDYPAWVELGADEYDAAEFVKAGMSPADVAKWEMDPADVAAWVGVGVKSPEDAAKWEDAGFDSEDAGGWASAGISPDTAAEWVESGAEPAEAIAWAKGGATPEIVEELEEYSFADEMDTYIQTGGWKKAIPYAGVAHEYLQYADPDHVLPTLAKLIDSGIPPRAAAGLADLAPDADEISDTDQFGDPDNATIAKAAKAFGVKPEAVSGLGFTKAALDAMVKGVRDAKFAAAAPIGTISQRKDGEYKKVAEGEWRRVTDGKTAGDATDDTPESKEIGKTRESTLAGRLIAGVAKSLGIGPKKNRSEYNQHATVSRKSDVDTAERQGLQELVDKGIDPDRAEVMLAAAKRFTENSGGVRAAQKGTWDGSEADRLRALKTGEAMEDYMKAVGPFDPGTKLIRGVAVPPDIAAQWVPGKVIDMQGAASSWSTNREIAENFIRTRERDGSVGVVFELDGGASRSASVRGISNFPHEDEVIVGKDVKYAIREVQRLPNGQVRIKLREEGGADE